MSMAKKETTKKITRPACKGGKTATASPALSSLKKAASKKRGKIELKKPPKPSEVYI